MKLLTYSHHHQKHLIKNMPINIWLSMSKVHWQQMETASFYSNTVCNVIHSVVCISRSILMKEVVQQRIPMLSQLVNGLRICGVLESIQSFPRQMKDMFCKAGNLENQLTSDKFSDLLAVQFSQQQQKKALEIDTYKYFCDFVDKMFHEGNVPMYFVNLF